MKRIIIISSFAATALFTLTGGVQAQNMQEYSLETGRCGRLYGSFAEVCSGTSRKELHCSYRKRYPARDAETMPADNIYSGSSQRQHLCLQ